MPASRCCEYGEEVAKPISSQAGQPTRFLLCHRRIGQEKFARQLREPPSQTSRCPTPACLPHTHTYTFLLPGQITTPHQLPRSKSGCPPLRRIILGGNPDAVPTAHNTDGVIVADPGEFILGSVRGRQSTKCRIIVCTPPELRSKYQSIWRLNKRVDDSLPIPLVAAGRCHKG